MFTCANVNQPKIKKNIWLCGTLVTAEPKVLGDLASWGRPEKERWPNCSEPAGVYK